MLRCDANSNWFLESDIEENSLPSLKIDPESMIQCGAPPYFMDVLAKKNNGASTLCYKIGGSETQSLCVSASSQHRGIDGGPLRDDLLRDTVTASPMLQSELLQNKEGIRGSDIQTQSVEGMTSCFVDKDPHLNGVLVLGFVSGTNQEQSCIELIEKRASAMNVFNASAPSDTEEKQFYLGNKLLFPFGEGISDWYRWTSSQSRTIEVDARDGVSYRPISNILVEHTLDGKSCKLDSDCDAAAALGHCNAERHECILGGSSPSKDCDSNEACDTFIHNRVGPESITGRCNIGTGKCSSGLTGVHATVFAPKGCISHNDCTDGKNIIGSCEEYAVGDLNFKGCRAIKSHKELERLRRETAERLSASDPTSSSTFSTFSNSAFSHARVCDAVSETEYLKTTLPMLATETKLIEMRILHP